MCFYKIQYKCYTVCYINIWTFCVILHLYVPTVEIEEVLEL